MADGRGVLPPGDADRRRPDPATSATPTRSAAATCSSTSSTRATSAGVARRRPRRRRACGCSTPGSRTATAAALTNVEHGTPDPAAGRAGDRSATPRRWRSASSSPTPTGSASSSSAPTLTSAERRQRAGGRASGSGSAPRSRTCSVPGATSSTAASTRPSDAGVALYAHERARLRRLRRRAAGPRRSSRLPHRDRGRRRQRGGTMSATPTPRRRAARGARPVGARRRLAALLRPALADLGDRVQAGLLRHRARLPLVADPAADAVRGAALRLHQGLQNRQRTGRALPGAAAARASSSSPSSRKRRPTPSARSSPRRASSARPSSRAW